MNVESIHCRCFPQGHNSKDNISGSFIFQDLNDSYPVLAPIRRRRGGDTVVIHGNQTSGNEAEIEEDEREDDDICTNVSGTEEEEEKRKEARSADTPVPPRFTKAVIWT